MNHQDSSTRENKRIERRAPKRERRVQGDSCFIARKSGMKRDWEDAASFSPRCSYALCDLLRDAALVALFFAG